MLKPLIFLGSFQAPHQPPSGGCVLKQHRKANAVLIIQPAAFGRLCVETISGKPAESREDPAAFGRLCVETTTAAAATADTTPAAFGRLCVETSWLPS